MDKTKPATNPSAFWPVVFPLLIGALLFLGLGAWAAAASARGADLGRWADLSALLILIFLMVISVFPLLILAGLAWGVFKLGEVVPQGTRWVGSRLEDVQKIIEKASSVVVEPVLRAKGFQAGLRRIFKRRG